MHTPLHDGWTVRAVAGPVPPNLVDRRVSATVPGCVHTDLLAAGLIPDPYLEENEARLTWIGDVTWCYETEFDWTGSGDDARVDQADLVALGLDTVATIRLNGTEVAQTANMHRSYRFPVGALLRLGRNELSVTFAAGRAEAEERSRELGPRPNVNKHPYNSIRKMAANYGWDWGPDVVTAGIWRPIGIETWHDGRLALVRPLVRVEGTTGTVEAHVSVQRAHDGESPLAVRLAVAGRVVDAAAEPGAAEVVLRLEVPDVERWWPTGFGSQPLYEVSVVLTDATDGELDRWSRRIGFRTVDVDLTPDEHGTPFVLRVNDVPIFVRGVNWIPDDCFPSRIDRDRYAARLEQAHAANVNLVRVWGGGIYESDDFYDVCDELGVLVWQDFLFACAAYAEEEPLRGEVIAEAREAVVRLGPHPSLVIWNGSNENVWGHAEWGWADALAGRTWGLGYYTDVLPAIVAELDPTRPYCLSSPYSPSPELHPNDPAHGTMHIWDVWNDRDYADYRAYVPRFVSEFGFQGPATWATLSRAVGEQALTPDSPAVLAHQKAEGGQRKLAAGLSGHLPVPSGFDDWHWATSLNQARAVAFGIEHFRSHRPVCMGTIVWQLNDCWPVISWSAIDGYGRRKPMWYALRRAYRDRLLTLQPRDGAPALVAVNDGGDVWHEPVRIRRVSFDGTTTASAEFTVDVDPGSSRTLSLPAEVATPADPAAELIVADAGGQRALWLFVPDVEAVLPPPEFTCEVSAAEGEHRVTITARSLLHDLTLLPDRLAADATVDEQLITLLPGETVTLRVRGAAGLDPAAFADPRVLRTANQFVAGVPSRPDVAAGELSAAT